MGVKAGVFRGKDGLDQMRRHILEGDRLALDVAGAADELAPDIHDEGLILTAHERFHVVGGSDAGIVLPDETQCHQADEKHNGARTTQAAQPGGKPPPTFAKLVEKGFHGRSAKEA